MLFEIFRCRRTVSCMTTKMQAGVIYTDMYREHGSVGEYPWFWQGNDGSVLEYTEEEKRARDGSSSLAD